MTSRTAKRRGFLGSLAVMLGIAGFAAGVMAAEPAVVLKMAVADAEGGRVAAMADAFARGFGGDGRIALEVTAYPGPDAGQQIHNELIGGTVDIAFLDVGVLARAMPALAGLTRPFLFANARQADIFYAGAGGVRIQEMVGSAGFRIPVWVGAYPPVVVADRALDNAEKYRGLRVAADPDPAFRAFLGALGATPVPLAAGQRLAALRSGALDALEAVPADILQAQGNTGGATFINSPGFTLPHFAVSCSNRTWTKIAGMEESFQAGLERGREAAEAEDWQANAQAVRDLIDLGYTISENDFSMLMEASAEAADAVPIGDQRLRQTVQEATAPHSVQ